MTAPTCPVSRNQPRGPASELTPRAKVPGIPAATDLPSLIRTVNIIRDVLRSLVIKTTINNVWPGKEPPIGYIRNKSFPSWAQDTTEKEVGWIFHKSSQSVSAGSTYEGSALVDRTTTTDEAQRVQIARTHRVEYFDTNEGTSDKTNRFLWSYHKKIDSDGRHNTGSEPMYIESFFERVINVKWKDYLAVEFGDGAGPGGGKPPGDNSSGGGNGGNGGDE